jgi:hypothetical protein
MLRMVDNAPSRRGDFHEGEGIGNIVGAASPGLLRRDHSHESHPPPAVRTGREERPLLPRRRMSEALSRPAQNREQCREPLPGFRSAAWALPVCLLISILHSDKSFVNVGGLRETVFPDRIDVGRCSILPYRVTMPTLRQLEYLVALADLRHFGRAAQASHVSQPSLSQQVRALEQRLGLELVERNQTRGRAHTDRAGHSRTGTRHSRGGRRRS